MAIQKKPARPRTERRSVELKLPTLRSDLPERKKLRILEAHFARVARRRPNFEEVLARRAVRDEGRQLREFILKSEAHHVMTRHLIDVIEAYANLRGLSKAKNMKLPKLMAAEIDQLKLRASIFRAILPDHLKQVVKTHNTRRAALARKVEKLLVRHGATFGLGSSVRE